VRDDPHLEAAEFNLGRSLMTLGRYGESAAALGRAVELDPYDGEAEADLGVVLARLGRLDQAIGHLKAAVRLDPALGQARSNLETLEAIARSRGR
jgi:Flp pilus assembly protein TadD